MPTGNIPETLASGNARDASRGRVQLSRAVQEGVDVPPDYTRSETFVPGVIPMQGASLTPVLVKPKPPVALGMITLAAREGSFTNWPAEAARINTKVAAAAGFFSSQGSDSKKKIKKIT
jgi:hypothetical protein